MNNAVSIKIMPDTHERLIRRKKEPKQSMNKVIIDLLDENIKLKRKIKKEKDDADAEIEEEDKIGL